MNTKYFIAGAEKNAVIPNSNANGAAWLVGDINGVANANEEIEALNSINTKVSAVINTSKFNLQTDTYERNGSIILEEYKPNYLKYKATTTGQAFAVFSEIYYPKGWTATIDGVETDIIQTNYVLRGLEVPPGDHTIEFTFAPKTYAIGDTIMLISSFLVLLSLGGGIFMSIKE